MGLVLTWRPDGLRMVCQLIRLCSAPHPLQERGSSERGRTCSSEHLHQLIVPAPAAASQRPGLFLLTEMTSGMCSSFFSTSKKECFRISFGKTRLLFQTTGQLCDRHSKWSVPVLSRSQAIRFVRSVDTVALMNVTNWCWFSDSSRRHPRIIFETGLN